MEINLRISDLIDKLGLNKSSFAAQVGVSQPIITHITNGRNNPGLEVLQKILQAFPEVNPDWLIMGRGEMFLNNQLRLKMITDLLSDINHKIKTLETIVPEVREKALLLEKMLLE